MLTPDQKGSVAEAAIYRVQCKWATRRESVVVVNCRSCRRGPNGFIRAGYTRAEVDLVVGYCAESGTCCALTPDVFERHMIVSFRLGPARNNQLRGIRWARDYELERLNFAARGAIAQLGERRHGMAEVAGSIPAGSIF